MRSIIRCLILPFLAALPALSQTPGNPTAAGRRAPSIDYEAARLLRIATAVRITEPISFDGHLDEAVWKLAVPATNFIQRTPDTGLPAYGDIPKNLASPPIHVPLRGLAIFTASTHEC
jgi:hypothetical protein